jgi:hypothetical protein
VFHLVPSLLIITTLSPFNRTAHNTAQANPAYKQGIIQSHTQYQRSYNYYYHQCWSRNRFNMALHPTAVATEGHTRKLKRSSSFGDALKRILPSNRRERGYTLREQYRMSEDSSRDSQDHVKSIFGGENVANGPAATLSGMNVPNGTATLTSDTKGEETKRPGAIRRMLRSLGSLKKKKIENLDAKSIINNSGDEQRVPIV